MTERGRGLLINAAFGGSVAVSDVKVVSVNAGAPPPVTPLTVTMVFPAEGASLPVGVPTTITGTVSRAGASVTVTGVGAATVVGTNWSRAWTPGVAGPVALQVTATESGDNANDTNNLTVVAGGAVAITSPPAGSYPEDQLISIVGTVSPSGTPVTVTHGATSLGSAVVVGTNWTLDWTPSTALAAANLVAHAGGVDSSPVSITITAVNTPDNILSAYLIDSWVRADTITPGDPGLVAALLDKISGGGHTAVDFTQATVANQPALNATGGPNGTPFVASDDVNDALVSTLTPSGVVAVPRWTALVCRARSPANVDVILGAGSNRVAIRWNTTGPAWQMWSNINGVALDCPAQNNTWGLLIAGFSGTAIDFLEWRGNRVVSGQASGVGTSGGTVPFTFFQHGSGSAFGPYDVAEAILVRGAWPDSTAEAAIRSYVATRYGAALIGL